MSRSVRSIMDGGYRVAGHRGDGPPPGSTVTPSAFASVDSAGGVGFAPATQPSTSSLHREAALTASGTWSFTRATASAIANHLRQPRGVGRPMRPARRLTPAVVGRGLSRMMCSMVRSGWMSRVQSQHDSQTIVEQSGLFRRESADQLCESHPVQREQLRDVHHRVSGEA